MKQILFFMTTIILAQKVPINSATLEQIKTLPLTEKQASSVYKYILFQGPIGNIYELDKVDNIQPENIQSLKPLISISLEQEMSSTVSRLSDRYSKVENWTSEEGANEGLVEVLLDRLAEPKNINYASWNDLMALQNVSPVDAVTVIKRIEEGEITYPKALRGAIGLSYWGYKNMVDFFTYKRRAINLSTFCIILMFRAFLGNFIYDIINLCLIFTLNIHFPSVHFLNVHGV